MSLTRRSMIAATTASALLSPAILRSQTLFSAYPFRLGVASGDPSADGFVIWTRLAPDPLGEHGGMPMQPVPLTWQVSTDQKFATIVQSGDAVARPELGHSVHVELTGLAPDRPYWYRFAIGSETSLTGRGRTAPLPGARPDRVRIAVAGCQHYEQGLYTAHRYLADEDVAFVFHSGDYIYEYRDSPVATDKNGRPVPIVREHAGQEIYSLDDYRRRYAQYKMDPDLQAAHAAAPWFASYDDHEVDNNWTADHDQDGSPREAFLLRRAAALQAWYEHMPVRRASFPTAGGISIARTARWGDLLHAHFLDTRQYRSPQPCGDGFKPRCTEVDRADAAILGAAQEARLAAALRDGQPRWTALAQQIMMMDLDRRTADEPAPIHNMDSWPAYTVPRRRLLDRLAERGNVVVLTGDEHQNHAGQVLGADGAAVAVEFVGTSISSGGDGEDQRPGSDRILANNPHLAFVNDQRGYLICDIGRDAWRTDFMTLDQVRKPGGTLTRRASFAVARGEARLHAG